MNIFSGNLRRAKIQATYVAQNHKAPLGTQEGTETPVTIIVTEAYTNNWQNQAISQTSDILVYAYPNSVLGRKTCEGGKLKFDGRELRIESFAVAKDQLTGKVSHIELGCSQL